MVPWRRRTPRQRALELAARTLGEQKAEIDALRVKLTHVKGSLSTHLAEVEASLEGGANGAPLTEQEREAVTMLQGVMLELVDSLDAPETKAGDETGPFEATYFAPNGDSMDTRGTMRPPDAHPGVAPDPTPGARAEEYSPLGTLRGRGPFYERKEKFF